MKKRFICAICVLLFISGFAFVVSAWMGSQSYRISTSVLSSGGAAMDSASFQMESTLGQPSPLMNSENPPISYNYDLFPGFWYTTDGVLLGEITVKMNIPEGWSMISLPVEPLDAKVSALFFGAEVVYGYEKDVGYVHVQNSKEIEVGKGYWILLNQEKTFSINGKIIDVYNLLVEDGWYMIGGCTYPALPSIVNGHIIVIYFYIPGLGYQRISASEKLETSKGYWILLKDIIGQTQLKVETKNP